MHQSARPASITLPPPPVFDSPPQLPQDHSPALQFHTAPSSPFADLPSPPVQWYTPPTSPHVETVPSPPLCVPHVATKELSPTDDAFPAIIDLAVDLGFGEESLTTLEKIYLYSRSESTVHRVFITHALPSYLEHVTPQEAIEYVLPLINGLAMDDEEVVKEALAAELVPVVWWFFSHCQIIPDDLDSMQSYASSSTTITISVQAFTPILGTLLLSSNPLIVGTARLAVVDLLTRMRRADDRESGVPPRSESGHNNLAFLGNNLDDDDDDEAYVPRMFKRAERDMFRHEILYSVVIGMGRLDLDLDYDPPPDWSQTSAPTTGEKRIPAPTAQGTNPYFPSLPVTHTSVPTETDNWSSHVLSPKAAASTAVSAAPEQPTSLSPVDHPSPKSRSNGSRLNAPASPTSPQPEAHMGLSKDPSEQDEYNTIYQGEENDEEQAAIGRLSSMSLIAAVTAAGTLEESVQRAFVKEVSRIGRDTGYCYVRREASLALGALAKIVPEEIVISSLLPLFDALRWDSDWSVRRSALFALPAVLPRLTPNQRRTVALETIMVLSADVCGAVRSVVLESLGEVLYTFHNDPGGPPNELLHLFLGRKEDVSIREGYTPLHYYPWMAQKVVAPLELFFTDPERPLICAFNFPAVALTLGPLRWHEIREVYLDIARNKSSKVRRTLAASLGELAKIIGQEAARRDLVDVWWDSIRFGDPDVRSKAVETLDVFLPVIGKAVGKPLLQGLLTLWEEGIFRGWRERERILYSLEGFLPLGAREMPDFVRALLMKGLEDNVAAVRQAAISLVPRIWEVFSLNGEVLAGLQSDFESLSGSPIFRRRMTFLACAQSRVLYAQEELCSSLNLEDLLQAVARLAEDPVEDVRIGLARLLSIIHAKSGRSRVLPPVFVHLVQRLGKEASHEVSSFLPDLQHGSMADTDMIGKWGLVASRPASRKKYPHPSTFSRPPLPRGPSSTFHDLGQSGRVNEGGSLIERIIPGETS